ncbi:MAG: TonB-dependent siderophore receptor [Pseudomonadota bacterium]
MLRGNGTSAIFGGNPGTVRLKRALLLGTALAAFTMPAWGQETEELIADEIVVEGDRGVVTEGTGSYAASRATVGGRQPQELREVPQTVNVITRQRLDDAAATTIEEAAYTLPGLTTATGDGFMGSLYARGQEVFQYYVDGAQRPFLSIYGTAPDLFFFDRVEVVSGPSGVFQGSGEPVGTLNLVRKRPLDEQVLTLGSEVNTFGGYRGELDFSTPFTEDNSVRGRFAFIAEQGESFTDFVEQDRYGGYGTVEIDIGDSTTFAFGTIIEHVDRAGYSGLPTFTDGRLLDVPRDTFIGSLYDASDTDTIEFFAELEHEFDYGGVAKATVRHYDRETNLLSALPSSGVDPATGDFTMFNFAREFEENDLFADINLTSPFAFGEVTGEVVVGADFTRSEQDFKQNFDFSIPPQNLATFDPFSLVQPAVNFPGVGPGFRLNMVTETSEYGFYAQGRAEVLPGLKINVGGRYSIYEFEEKDTGRDLIRGEAEETNFAPYAGITYDVTDNITLYGSFASIFQPQPFAPLAAGGQVEPRKGRQLEGGIKAEFFNGDLQAQASYYRIRDKNRAVDDPANLGFFLGTEEARTEGLEFTLAGSPIEGLELSVGFVHVNTELLTDPSPENSFVAFGKYTFEEGFLDGLSLGAGVRAASGFDNLSGTTFIEAPGYTVFDALVGYELTENVAAQLNVRNLLDRTYYDRVNQVSRGNFFGEPLNATLRLTATF